MKPNIIIIFPDQMRYQAAGFAGDPNVKTPNLNQLAGESLNFTNAVSCCPVCSPARASLLTGQYPHRHGIIINDVNLSNKNDSLATVLKNNGYDTAYIGKWHLDGHGRDNYIPPERRQGFDFWKVRECTHDYYNSFYYEGNSDEQKLWDGYDAFAQTEAACKYIEEHNNKKPFLLILSWGPPHEPYNQVPEEYKKLYDSDKIKLRPNVPRGNEFDPELKQVLKEKYGDYFEGINTLEDKARKELAGYYAHITALDDDLGKILDTVEKKNIEEETIFIFWSDHGDMLGSQGMWKKQSPYDESIRVPFIIKYPALFGKEGKKISSPINTPDIMPTILGLCDIDIPASVEGNDYTPFIKGETGAPAEEALIACYFPFGQWNVNHGGREYRGIRTEKYTYAKTHDGPWLLYNNEADPYQKQNLIEQASSEIIAKELEIKLDKLLKKYGDDFASGEEIMTRFGYKCPASKLKSNLPFPI